MKCGTKHPIGFAAENLIVGFLTALVLAEAALRWIVAFDVFGRRSRIR